jgi:prophage regulatory protein
MSANDGERDRPSTHKKANVTYDTDLAHGFNPGGIAMLPNRSLVMLVQKTLVSKKELRSVYGIPYSFQHIARLEKSGQFPKRVQLGPNRVAWLCLEIEDWIASRVARRSA